MKEEQRQSGGSAAPLAPLAIEVEGLSKRYGDHEAVRDLSFSVHAGEVVGFLGPNGAGKTTVMRILTGFLPATDGTARIPATTSSPIRSPRAGRSATCPRRRPSIPR